ncbi:MAG: DNA-directed DNA polymerase I [Promethearchaeota archaeon]
MVQTKKKSTRKKKKKKSTKSKRTDLFDFIPKKKGNIKRNNTMGKQKKERKTDSKSIEKITIKSTIKKNHPQKKTIQRKELKKENKTPNEAKKLTKSDLTFYNKNEEPFGEFKFKTSIDKKDREARKSQYLRYLIANDQICKDMEQGLLLTVEYCGTQNKAYARFYDLKEKKIKFWVDTTNHQPYCLHKDSKKKLEENEDLIDFYGFDRIETVKKYDLLEDKEIEMSKIYATTPNVVGGSGDNKIKAILGGAWEANIRYHHNFIYDRELIPGLIYRINKSKLELVEFKINPGIEKQFLDLYKDEKTEFQEMAKKYLKIFSSEIPNIRRVAFDIEVDVPERNQLPNAKLAKQKVISVSFSASDGMNKVYVLWNDTKPIGKKPEEFPKNAEIIFFKKEKDLIEETFRIIWEYPLIISFNGDNFDFNYLFHRARKLKISPKLNPIQLSRGGGSMVSTYAYLKHGIHLDLYQVFANRSLKGYAFGNAYDRNSLDDITKALLGSGKIKHESGEKSGEKFSAEDIASLDYHTLAYYNMMDSVLTLELTRFGNNTVWNLLVYLLRITKLPLQDLFRHQISFWIRSIMFFEHKVRNYLIPRISEIRESKKGGIGKSIIDGKGFEGGFVIEPIPGIHFNVVVTDFSSLYPSIIKSRNLSYETIMCKHSICESNLLPNLPYHVCTQRVGIFALIVGFFRDVRVNWFKPRSLSEKISQDERNFAKVLQSALKVFINGSYGTFGSPNFPLYCLPVAEATTSIGRYSIKETIDKAESMGVRVLYGDTDSVFLDKPSKEQIQKLIKWSTDHLKIDLEEEKTYQFLALSERKKNYVGIYKDSLYVDIKGMTGKKKNTAPFIKKSFKNVTNILKKIKNMQDFKKYKKEIIKKVRIYIKRIGKPTEKGGYLIEDYTISIQLRKKLSDYKTTTPQHVKAALMEEKNSGFKYNPGDTVRLIKAKGSGGVLPFNMAKIKDIDIDKYKDLLKGTFEQLFDALEISFETDIAGTKRLDSFF